MPSGDAAVARVLAPLMFLHRPGDEGLTLQQRGVALTAELEFYQRALRDLPPDLLEMACDHHGRNSKYFPKPAEIREVAEAEFTKRQLWLRRIDLLEIEAKRPRQPKPFEPEPEIDRLRADIARWKNNSGHFMAETLKRRAVASERRLAEIDQREPEEWARDVEVVRTERQPDTTPVGGPSKMPSAGAVTRAVMRDTTRAMERSAVAEEPPPPSEVIEGNDDAVEP